MKVKMIVDYYSFVNDFEYKKGQIVDVTELEGFNDSYAVYRYDTVDWIPKAMTQII